MKANASKHKALSFGHASKLEERLEEEVRALLEMAEAIPTKKSKRRRSIFPPNLNGVSSASRPCVRRRLGSKP